MTRFETIHGIFSDRHEGFSLLTGPDSSEDLGPREPHRYAALVSLPIGSPQRTMDDWPNPWIAGVPIPAFRVDKLLYLQATGGLKNERGRILVIGWRVAHPRRGEGQHSSQRQARPRP